jgi:acetate kinase
MGTKILVVNSGSSSIKYRLFGAGDFSLLASGMVEKIGESGSRQQHRWKNLSGKFDEIKRSLPISNHREGFQHIGNVTSESKVLGGESELLGVGHRVVHGGEVFHGPALIDGAVLSAIRELIPLAPLHNPENLLGIEAALEHYPHVPQVAVFDTAFHQSLPPYAFHYALPYDFYTAHRVRRYGFHGTSHHYVAKRAAMHLGKLLTELNLITLHLGNGASATAIQGGKSVDTSMGLTPLEGLVMGTRCGDLDPAIPFYLGRRTGKSSEDLESLLNHQSGLKGICDINDMREILPLADGGDSRAMLAVEIFCYRIKKYIGAYFAALGRVDAIVFTGGIGENAASIRNRCCQGLEGLGIIMDGRKNSESSGRLSEIQADGCPIKILVIPTNEELEIARQTVQRIQTEPVESCRRPLSGPQEHDEGGKINLGHKKAGW